MSNILISHPSSSGVPLFDLLPPSKRVLLILSLSLPFCISPLLTNACKWRYSASPLRHRETRMELINNVKFISIKLVAFWREGKRRLSQAVSFPERDNDNDVPGNTLNWLGFLLMQKSSHLTIDFCSNCFLSETSFCFHSPVTWGVRDNKKICWSNWNYLL